MARVGRARVVDPAERVVEDAGGWEGGERRRISDHPHAPADRSARRAADRNGRTGDRGDGLPRVALQRHPEVAPAVEAHLLHSDYPGRVTALDGDPGHDPRP